LSSQFIESVNSASPTRTSTFVEARRMHWPWRITRIIGKKSYRYAAHDNCEIRKEIVFLIIIYLDRNILIVMINVEFLSFSFCFTVSVCASRNSLVNYKNYHTSSEISCHDEKSRTHDYEDIADSSYLIRTFSITHSFYSHLCKI